MTHRNVMPIGFLIVALMLASCVVPGSAAPPSKIDDPVAAAPTPPLTVIITADSIVRTGPDTDHAARFWLQASTEVAVTGRNADGTWLQIEHGERVGWFFGALTDITAEILADLPYTTPADLMAAELESTPEPISEPGPQISTSLSATVTGTVVNLRTGPSTEHAIDSQLRGGDQVRVTGRNTDGDWLQIVHPLGTGDLVWIYAPLTDIGEASIRTLAIETAPTQEAAATSAPMADPAPVVPQPAPSIEDCTQWHTVNPNEKYLAQITDWFGLDLYATAALNGLDINTPLVVGNQICLGVSRQAPTPPPANPTPAPGVTCLTRTGRAWPCPDVPGDPEHTVREVTGLPVTYHAPGTYDRSEHPGLAYDFELVLEDRSGIWDWQMRDFEGCYDALRVHMGDAPEKFGLKRLEVHLYDPIFGKEMEMDDLAREQIRGMRFEKTPLVPQPRPEPDYLPDTGVVKLRCFAVRNRPADDVLCGLFPTRGNSGSINLDAALNLALASTAGHMSRQSRAYQYFWENHNNLPYIPYLYPMLANGNPAGRGPCLELTRAR